MPASKDSVSWELLADTAVRARQYLSGLPDRAVSPSATAVAKLAELDTPVPEQGEAPAGVLARLDQLLSPATMAMAGPRFFGFVIGGSLPAALAANWLATAWDQNTGLHAVTPGTSQIERIALAWLLELLDLPRDAAGAFVTGATVANLTALAAARHRVLARAGQMECVQLRNDQGGINAFIVHSCTERGRPASVPVEVTGTIQSINGRSIIFVGFENKKH